MRATIGLFSGPDFYAVAQNVVSTSMFSDAVGDVEPPIGTGLCRVVDTNFREHPLSVLLRNPERRSRIDACLVRFGLEAGHALG